jgi:Ca2+-transporting ATPase
LSFPNTHPLIRPRGSFWPSASILEPHSYTELLCRPAITIDTTNIDQTEQTHPHTLTDAAASSEPYKDEDSVSPTTTMDPSGGWSGKPPAPVDTTNASDGRPQSPHNVSTPVAGRGDGGFLSIPANLHSRQNSIDEDDAHTAASATTATEPTAAAKKTAATLNNDKIMNDAEALKMDKAEDKDAFEVANNPFAFSPGQLSKLFDPKSLPAFYALGGLDGIEKGLRSDRRSGLSADETALDGAISFESATGHKVKQSAAAPGAVKKSHTGSHKAADAPFVDRKRVYSDNRLPEKKGKSLLEIMWITYNDKILILLSAAAVISLAVGIYQTVGIEHKPGEPGIEWVEGVAIVAAILIVVLVGSLNDYQKERQFAKLNRKKQDRSVNVTRSGKQSKVSVHDLMAGDVIHLEPGDLIPVDGILIQGFNIKCDESQATGESDIIRKRPADEVYAAIQNHQDLKKMDPFIQSGARVMEGVGTYMATGAGIHSSYGKTLMSLNEATDMTPLQSKLNVIAEYIAKIGGAIALLLFIVLFIQFLVRLKGSTKTPTEKGQDFLNIFIVVVTIIVVAVPEGLPLAVTLALAFATTRMIKDNNLVRLLKACEVMGNATTICSDKTGTLTQNKMMVVAGTIGTSTRFGSSRALTDGDDADDSALAADDGADITPSQFAASLSSDVKQLLLKSISLNSTAFEGEVDGVKTYIGSKTETALLLLARDNLGMGPVAEERDNVETLQMIPFDSGRKCMGIVIRLSDGRARLMVKGASEIVLDRCTSILANPVEDLSAAPLTPNVKQTVEGLIESYASRSLRTIGLVYRDFESWPPKGARRVEDGQEIDFDSISNDMTLIGVVGIQDPLREGVTEAVRLCQRAGVVVRMVTGDNKLTAESIARECGILQSDSIVMEGPEFRRLSRQQQKEIAPRLHVLARSSPDDKRTLVKRLKALGETVAVTGDGTNDAPALKTADIGFSMGIAGTEVAKEASDIILMDDNFNSIVSALKWGRAVNDAVKRFLQFQLTVNVTAVITTFVTAVADSSESSVLTAVQLLWVNLIMDTLAALALATDPPSDSVLSRKPERKGSSIITVTMWKMIIGQAIYQLAITFMLYWGANADPDVLPTDQKSTPEQVNVLVFNTFVWMQIFNQWNNRRLDNKFNIFEGITKNWIFIAISIVMCGAQVLIIFFGGAVFNIPDEGQSAVHWGTALVLGAISLPIGVIIRLIPDSLLLALVPNRIREHHRNKKAPGFTISDEDEDEQRENGQLDSPFEEVRDQLLFLKMIKGGRLNNLRFAMRQTRDNIRHRTSRSPSHSRTASVRNTAANGTDLEAAEGADDSVGSAAAPTPDSRQRSRSIRSRSNSALGAPTVMAGLVAAGVAAGWQPGANRSASRPENRSSAVESDDDAPAEQPQQ